MHADEPEEELGRDSRIQRLFKGSAREMPSTARDEVERLAGSVPEFLREIAAEKRAAKLS